MLPPPHHSPSLDFAAMSAPPLNGSLPVWSNQLSPPSYHPPHLNQSIPHSYAHTAPSNSSSIGPASTSLTTPALVSPVPPMANSPHLSHSEPSPSVHSISSHPRTPGSRPPLGPQALSLAEYADVHADRHSLSAARPAVAGFLSKPEPNYPDPIEMRILGHVEAEMLFERYHTVLSSYINLTDRKYHTVERVQKQSTVLFTALLTVSAKFFRPSLYPQLHSLAQSLLARGLADTLGSVGFLQALLLLVYWKEPEDRSAWMRIGWAIRMGYHLGINVPREGPLPEDEWEARATLDRERTWLNLICFDQCYRLHSLDSEGFGPPMLVLDPRFRIDEWMNEVQVYGCGTDICLPFSVESGRVDIMVKAFKVAPNSAQELAPHLMHMIETVALKYLDPVRSALCRPFGSQQMAKMRHFAAATRVHILLTAITALPVAKTDMTKFAHLIPYVADLLSGLENELVGHDIIDYLQDTIAVTFFGLAEGLIQLFPRVGHPNQATIVKWLTRGTSISSPGYSTASC